MNNKTEEFNNWNWLWMVPLGVSLSPIGWFLIMLFLKFNWVWGVGIALTQIIVYCILFLITNGGE